jgi:hypothetical protein
VVSSVTCIASSLPYHVPNLQPSRAHKATFQPTGTPSVACKNHSSCSVGCGVAELVKALQKLVCSRSGCWVPGKAALEEGASSRLTPSFRNLLQRPLPWVRLKALCTLKYLLHSTVGSECRASGKAFEHDHADRPHIEGRLNCELGHAAVSIDGLWRGIA